MTIDQIFSGIDKAKIAVVGDFCLDIYWTADMTRSKLSRETPNFPLPVVNERISCGAAGNVACNVSALRPAAVEVFGIIGSDWRGEMLKKLLRQQNIGIAGLIEASDRVTNAYCKPLKKGYSDDVREDPRIDFENSVPASEVLQDRLLEMLSACDADYICVCDQMENGSIGETFRSGICRMGQNGRNILVDSREHIGDYTSVIVKPNEIEAEKVFGTGKDYPELVRKLEKRTGRTALITLGEKGCIISENGTVTAVPAKKVVPPVDICGAGDTFMSALACALAAGCTIETAALFGNTASSVTVKKLLTTGTASRDEMRKKWEE